MSKLDFQYLFLFIWELLLYVFKSSDIRYNYSLGGGALMDAGVYVRHYEEKDMEIALRFSKDTQITEDFVERKKQISDLLFFSPQNLL